MNRTYLSNLIGALFRAPAGDNNDAGGGESKDENKGGETQVSAADARTALTQFGHAEESLKGMKDEDVLKLHGTVNGTTQKLVAAAGKAAQEKAAQEAAATKAKWEKGELKLELPKDSKLHQSDVDEIAAIARERGLSQDVAAAMLTDRAKAISGFETRQIEAFKAQRGKWVQEIEKDPELGGDNLVNTQKYAMLAIERFVPAPMREFLRTTGLGDNPDVVRTWVKIGRAMAEDKGGIGGENKGGGGGTKDAADVLYAETTSKQS